MRGGERDLRILSFPRRNPPGEKKGKKKGSGEKKVPAVDWKEGISSWRGERAMPQK